MIGRPFNFAIFFAWILSPISAINFELGPINFIPCLFTTSANFEFSDNAPSTAAYQHEACVTRAFGAKQTELLPILKVNGGGTRRPYRWWKARARVSQKTTHGVSVCTP